MTTPSELSEFVEIIDDADIVEISPVTTPAQEDALATIMKSGAGKVDKAFRLLNSVDGHSHLIEDTDPGGQTSWEISEGADEGHSHPYVKNADGTFTVGDAEGHKHRVLMAKRYTKTSPGDGAPDGMVPSANTAAGATGNGPGENTMPATNTAEPKDMAAKVDKLEKDLAKSTALAEHNDKLAKLNDAEKAHMGALPESARPAFLALEGDARKSELAKAVDADPVILKSEDGTEYRKSDDPRLVKMAKQADEDRKVAKAEIAKREEMELQKRATSPDLEHYGAKPDVTAAMLKALDGIEDETTRKAAIDSLKASSSTNAAAFKTAGYRGGNEEDSDDPMVKIDKLTAAYATKNGTSIAKAMSEVLKTEEGKALHKQTLEENPTH